LVFLTRWTVVADTRCRLMALALGPDDPRPKSATSSDESTSCGCGRPG
jgi:hypothetical protein